MDRTSLSARAQLQTAGLGLGALQAATSGSQQVVVGLIDGPVLRSHAGLARARIELVAGAGPGDSERSMGWASMHGSFVASMLVADPGSEAPGICPGCTLLVCPIFTDDTPMGHPGVQAPALAAALHHCLDAGAKVINLSLAILEVSLNGSVPLNDALSRAFCAGALVVAAAGNGARLSSSSITRHAAVVPVVGCDTALRPLGSSNLSRQVSRNGLLAYGENVVGLNASGGLMALGGTSFAAPFVSGAAALLWSAFPEAAAVDIRRALLLEPRRRRTAPVPPLLQAGVSLQHLQRRFGPPTCH